MLERPRRIYDNIYGFIRLTKFEDEVIKTPYFQRLRHISQMGTVNYVFPSAERTRFSHSLGVFHIMQRILDNLKTQKDANISDEDQELLEVTALLHDIGHYPCSHAIEAVYMYHMDKTPKGNVVGDITAKDGISEEFDGNHEKLGRHIVISKYRDMIDNHFRGKIRDASLEVGNAITGDSTVELYNQLMHSDLDADRLDYLIRDSEFMGSRYGQFDIDQLIRNIIIDPNSEGKTVIIDKRGLNALENYMLSRYFSRSLLISNKTIMGFEILLQTAFELLLEEQGYDEDYPYSYQNLLKTSVESEFIEFNDHYLFSKVFEASQGKSDTPLKRICRMVVDRNPLKEVCKFHYLNRLDTGEKCREIEKIKDIHENATDKDRFMNILWTDGDEQAFFKYGGVKMIRRPEVTFSGEDLKSILRLYDRSNGREKYSYLYNDKQSIMSELCTLKNEFCGVYAVRGYEDSVRTKVYRFFQE